MKKILSVLLLSFAVVACAPCGEHRGDAAADGHGGMCMKADKSCCKHQHDYLHFKKGPANNKGGKPHDHGVVSAKEDCCCKR